MSGTIQFNSALVPAMGAESATVRPAARSRSGQIGADGEGPDQARSQERQTRTRSPGSDRLMATFLLGLIVGVSLGVLALVLLLWKA